MCLNVPEKLEACHVELDALRKQANFPDFTRAIEL